MELQVKTTNNLVSRIVAGDQVAETELVERYAIGIRSMLLKKTGSRQLSHDICQDAMIVTLKKLRAGNLRKPESLRAFIWQTASYLCIDYYRKEKRYVRQESGIISRHAPHIDRKAQAIDNQHACVLLEELLEQLSIDRDREILRRFYLNDEDKGSICRDLGLSCVHFDRVLYRARQRMRVLIRQRSEFKALLFESLLDD